jgi:hypothetical protein
MLAFENEVRQEIEITHHKELVEARELMQLALDMLGSDGDGNLKVPSKQIPGVGDWARSLALGLLSKACKQFRTIIMLGEAGFGGEMSVLTRSVFETVLTLEFLMREQVVLKRNSIEVDIDPTRILSTNFRTQLYGARTSLISEKQLKEWGEHPELKDSMAILGDPGVIAAQATAARNAVGEEWWKALKRGVAGLRICALITYRIYSL